MLPNDPIMLLSAVNMRLRDRYATLDALCQDEDISREELEKKLSEIGYTYDAEMNRFA